MCLQLYVTIQYAQLCVPFLRENREEERERNRAIHLCCALSLSLSLSLFVLHLSGEGGGGGSTYSRRWILVWKYSHLDVG